MVIDFGVGCVMGDGQQWMSWIEQDDLVRVIAFAIANEDIEGALNATAPHPVRNLEFTHALAQALNRPVFLRAPHWVLANLGKYLVVFKD